MNIDNGFSASLEMTMALNANSLYRCDGGLECHLRYENTAIPPAEQALEEGPCQRRRIECPAGVQFIVAVSRAHALTFLPYISYHSLSVLLYSASSRQSIPAFGRPLLQGGTHFRLFSILRSASLLFCAASLPCTLILNPEV